MKLRAKIKFTLLFIFVGKMGTVKKVYLVEETKAKEGKTLRKNEEEEKKKFTLPLNFCFSEMKI